MTKIDSILFMAIRDALGKADVYNLFTRDIADPAGAPTDKLETAYALMFDIKGSRLYFFRDATDDTNFGELEEEENDNLFVLGYVSAMELLGGKDIAGHIISDLKRYVIESHEGDGGAN